jgi:hypothetical protein
MSFKRSHVESLEHIPNSAMAVAKGLCKNYFGNDTRDGRDAGMHVQYQVSRRVL